MNNAPIENNPWKFTLCRGNGSCCPIITETEYGYTIADDFGGTVKLTADQMSLLRTVVERADAKAPKIEL